MVKSFIKLAPGDEVNLPGMIALGEDVECIGDPSKLRVDCLRSDVEDTVVTDG